MILSMVSILKKYDELLIIDSKLLDYVILLFLSPSIR